MQHYSAPMPQIAFDPSEEDERGFACPFFQRDPPSFGHGKWKICAHHSWKEYHRVREHVYRKHMLPSNHCDRCFEDLRDAESLLLHRGQLQCEQKAFRYVTDSQVSQLRVQMKRGTEEFEKWKNMYRILFPEDTSIPSPYKEVPSDRTDEFRAWAAEIEGIRNSSSLDVRTQIQQIMSVAKKAIREVCSQSSGVQHDFQDTTSGDVMAAAYSGTIDMSSTCTPDLGPLGEYMSLSADLIDASQLSGVSASMFGDQDDSASHTLDSSYAMDTDLMGIGEFPY